MVFYQGKYQGQIATTYDDDYGGYQTWYYSGRKPPYWSGFYAVGTSIYRLVCPD